MEPELPQSLDVAVLEWIKSAAIPLATVEPGRGSFDLRPLAKLIGGARIVSLGEATHGTREFFKLKHRILEFCVVELGFTMFGIEASFPDTLDVNAYVLEGKGDAVEVARGMGFWTWDTSEVVDMIEWTRRWNRSAARKVKFYGFDMQSPQRALPRLVDYLARVAPDLSRRCADALAPLSSEFTARRFGMLPAAEREPVTVAIARAIEAFDEHRAAWSAATSALDWSLQRLNAVTLRQGASDAHGDAGNNLTRDEAMADNVLALLEAEGPEAKAVLWSHNGHAGRIVYDAQYQAMGKHLDARVGREHVVIGFSFGRGSFQARGYPTGELMDHHVAGAPAASFDAMLARAGPPLFALGLLNAPPEVEARLDAKMPMWMIGAAFGWPDRDYQYEIAPRQTYDALIFVAETTPALGNGPRGYDPLSPPADAPSNLGLSGEGLPWGWRQVGAWRPDQYEIAVAAELSPLDGRTLRISRHATPGRRGEGELVQKIIAEPWRGKRVKFSAAIRTSVEELGSGALLTLKWLPKPDGMTGELFLQPFATFASALAPERPSHWERVAVEAVVPEEADSIAYGLLLTGNGDAWFGDLAFEGEEA